MSRKITLIALSLVVMIMPLLVAEIVLRLKLHASLLDFVPFWSDEIWHWHQMMTFARAGWNGGYYSLDENIPLAGFSHFYSWGAWIYVYYGLIARLLPFNVASLMFINIGSLMAATALFIRLVRPSVERLLLLGAVLATFVPLIQYLPSGMPLVLQLSIALLIAAGFYPLLRGTVSARYVIIMSVLLVLAGLSRPPFTAFLFPLYVLASKKRNWKTILRAIVLSVPLTLISAAGFYLSAAPFPHFRTRLFLGAGTLGEKFQSIINYLKLSMVWLRTNGDGPIFAMRYHILLLLVLMIIWGGCLLWQMRQGARKREDTMPLLWEISFHLFNLFGLYALILLFHEALDGHDYRVMAPHLFVSLTLLVAMRRRVLVLIMVVASLAAFPALWTVFDQKLPNFNGIVRQEFNHWQPIVAQAVPYAADAPNSWCNTIVMSEFYTRPFGGEAGLTLALPPGLGLSWAYDWDDTGRFSVPEGFKAHYLMVHDNDYANWQNRLHVREIVRVHEGAIYDNLDSLCYG